MPHSNQNMCEERNGAMDDVHVRVQFGKDYFEVDISLEGTFGDIRKQTETKMGLVDGGVKLLYKGKKYGDSVTLKSIGMGASTRSAKSPSPKIGPINMMAMRTNLQHENDKQSQRQQKLSEKDHKKPVDPESRPPHTSSVNESHQLRSMVTSVSSTDADSQNATSVVVSHGRHKYRIHVNLEGGDTGRDIKERLCALGGRLAGWFPDHVRLLAKGRIVKDDQVLRDMGVRYGDAMMAIDSAERHASVQAAQEVTTLTSKIQTFSENVGSLDKRMRTRVLSTQEAIVQVEELKRECERLRSHFCITASRSKDSSSNLALFSLKSDLDAAEETLKEILK